MVLGQEVRHGKSEAISLSEGSVTCNHVSLVHGLPAEDCRKLLGLVALLDTLTPVLLAKTIQAVGELMDTVFVALLDTINDIETMLFRFGKTTAHVAGETSEVGSDRRHTRESTLSRSVTPRLVVRAEDTEMTTTDEFRIVKRQDGAHGIDEFRMVHDLDAIVLHVEKMHATEMVEDFIRIVVDNVVRNDGRQTSGLDDQLKTTLEGDEVLLRDKRREVGHVATKNLLVETISNLLSNIITGLTNLPAVGLTTNGLDVHVVDTARHDDKSNNGHINTVTLEHVVELSESIEHQIDTLVEVLTPASSEEVECFLKIEVIAAKKVTTDELTEDITVLSVEVLELVNGSVATSVETVRSDDVSLTTEQFLGFSASDLTTAVNTSAPRHAPTSSQ